MPKTALLIGPPAALRTLERQLDLLERMWVEAGELQIKVAPALQAAVLRAALMQLPRPMRHWVLGELRAMGPR